MRMTGRTLLWVVGLLAAVPLSGQVGPRGSGVVEVGLALRQMDGVKRVLMIGAHPDDEDLLRSPAGWASRRPTSR
jgi:hypothetical protein